MSDMASVEDSRRFMKDELDDKELIKTITEVKRDITSFLNRKETRKTICDAIDASECLNFLNKRAKAKAVNGGNNFLMLFDWAKAVDKYAWRGRTGKDVMDFKTMVVGREVVSEVSRELGSAVVNESEKMLDEIPPKEQVRRFIMSNVFTIRLGDERSDSEVSMHLFL